MGGCHGFAGDGVADGGPATPGTGRVCSQIASAAYRCASSAELMHVPASFPNEPLSISFPPLGFRILQIGSRETGTNGGCDFRVEPVTIYGAGRMAADQSSRHSDEDTS